MNRSSNFVKNTIVNYFFRVLGMLIGFITVPITLAYLGDVRYGIWQTMISMISWAAFANFGIGNGLRNKVTELIALNENSKLKANISSAYSFILKISIFLCLILLVLILSLDVTKLFKDVDVPVYEIKVAFIIVIISFCANFVIGLCNSIAFGIHKSYYVTVQQTINSLVILVIIYFVGILMESSLIYMALIYTIITTLANMILSLLIFKKNNNLIPKTNYNKSEVDKSMYSLGLNFFILQIGSLLLATTDNFLISILISTESVTNYSIVHKLFITINTLFTILMIPLWNSSADAVANKEFDWIVRAIKKLSLLLIPIFVVIVLIILLFDTITKLWIGKILYLDNYLLVFMGVYILLLCFNSIFANIQNGMGRVKIQIISVIIAAAINIPLAYYFVKDLNLSTSGIVLANIISQLIIALFCPLDVIITLKKRLKEKK